MKIENKHIIVIFAFVFTSIMLIVLCAYFFNVSLSFSTDTNAFGAFGSYFGGVLAPFASILSIATIIYIHYHDKVLILKQIKEQQNNYQLNIYETSIVEIKTEIEKIINKKLKTSDLIDVFIEYNIADIIMVNPSRLNLFKSSPRETQIEMVTENSFDLITFMNILYQSFDDKTFTEIIKENKLYNFSHHLDNIITNLTYLVFFNEESKKITKNYIKTMYNLSGYFEIVKILNKCGMISSDSMLFKYFKCYEENKLMIPTSFDVLEFDETYKIMARFLTSENEELRKYGYNEIFEEIKRTARYNDETYNLIICVVNGQEYKITPEKIYNKFS